MSLGCQLLEIRLVLSHLNSIMDYCAIVLNESFLITIIRPNLLRKTILFCSKTVLVLVNLKMVVNDTILVTESLENKKKLMFLKSNMNGRSYI